MINHKRLPALAALIAASAFLCGAARAEVVGKIAAIVNSDVITERDITRAMQIAGTAKNQPKAATNADRQQVLDKLVDERLMNQIMDKSKIEVTDDDLARAIANILYKNRITIDQLKSEIESKGMSYNEYTKQISRDIKRIKFINQVIGPQVSISDQDLRDYYQKNQQDFRGSHSAHLAEIILPLSGIQNQEEFDAYSQNALSITAKAKRGTSFDSLAKQYSKGSTAAAGGDVGMVDLKELPPPVAEAVKQMRPGDVSNPIVVDGNLVIVKVISLPEIAMGDFDKVRDDIYSALYEKKIEETLTSYLQRERQKAFIEER